MADVIFINRTDVKWNDTYDSYMVNSKVGGDTEAGASLTLGNSEVLSATAGIVSVATSLITAGINELLASSQVATSSTPAAILTLGVTEELSSTVNSVSTTSGFITMGGAEDLASTSVCITTTTQVLELGIVEVVSSTIATTSVTAGPLLTIGQDELLTSLQLINSNVNGLLDLGVSELLASTSINASTTNVYMDMGVVEPLSATATCVVAETTKELTMGEEAHCSTGVIIQSSSVSLLDLGVTEVLGSTDPIVSTVSAAVLTIGIGEDLSSTTNISSTISSPDLILGITEVLTATASTIIPVSDSGLTLGIQEATASTGSIISTVLNSILTMGENTPLSSTIDIESISSSFLNLGITEVLEATDNITSLAGAPDLLLGEQELLAALRASVSTTIAELTLGITEELSATDNITTTVGADIILGYNEILSTTEIFFSYSTAELTLGGGIEELSSTINIVSSVTAVNLTLGITEVLSATDNIVSSTSSLIVLGISELLASTIANASTTDADMNVGGSEILSSTNGVIIISTISCNTIDLGITEVLTSTSSNVINVSDSTLLSGGAEIVTSSITAYSNVSTPQLILGTSEYMSSTINIISMVNVALILGVTEDLSHACWSGRHPDSATDECNGGTAFGDYDHFHTPSNAFDDDTDTYWHNMDHSLPISVGYNFGSGNSKTITKYRLMPSSLYTGHQMKNWTFQGYDGGVWTTLHTVSNETDWTQGEYNEYSFSNTTDYWQYRLVITDTTVGSDMCGLNEFEMLETIPNTFVLTKTVGQSTTSGLVDLGVTEILSDVDNALVSNVSGELTLGGGIEELAHTLFEFSSGPVDPYAVSISSNAVLDLGVDEILGVSQSTTSSTDAVLSLGSIESLSSTINITSTETNDITIGIVEELSNECVCWTSIGGLLVVGLTEILSSTSISNSVADAVLSFGVPESLAHTIGDDDIPGQSLDTGDLFIDGETFVQDENAVHTITLQGGTAISTDEYRYGESSIYFDGDGDGMTIPDHTDFDVQSDFTFDFHFYAKDLNNWDRLFIIQNDEDNWLQVYFYNNQVVCRLNKGGVLYDGILSGTISTDTWYHLAFTHTHATNTMKMYLEGVEKTTTTNAAMEAIEYYYGYIEGIRWEKNAIRWTSNFDVSDNWDMDYEVAAIPEFFSVSNTDGDLTIGHTEELTHSITITTEADGLTLVTGVAEILASATFSVSVTVADLILGVTEDLSSTINVVSNISSILTLGADTPLAHTSAFPNELVELNMVGELGFGVSEYMGTANASQSTTYANLILGTGEVLSATSSLIVDGVANLGFGIIETASVSTSFTSSSDADLTLGIVEELSATSSSNISSDADITMGAETPLSSSYLVQSDVTGTILFGVTELLASTGITASTADASLILGTVEHLTATGISVSNTTAFITMGVVESLSATQGFISSAASIATLGVEEVLSATNALAQSIIIAEISTGGMEMIEGATGITSYAIALLDLGVSEMLAGTDPIVSNVAANLTLGNVEPLAHTAIEAPSSPTYGTDLTDSIGGTPWASHYDFPQDSTLVFDNDANTYWIASYDEDPYPYTLRWDFGDGNDTAVQRYTLSLPAAHSGKGGEDWTFEGSDDGATNWTVLDTQTGISWTAGETKTFSFNNLNDYRYYRWIFTKGEHVVDLVVGEAQLLQYNETYVHTFEVADSVVTAAITMGVDELLSSTINLTIEADGTIATGVIEMLGTLGFGNTVTDGTLTLGVEEPLAYTSASGLGPVSNVIGDLGIPGTIEECSSTINIVSTASVAGIDTGVVELMSAFRMIWSQIHTPIVTMGITELISSSIDINSVVGASDLIKGIVEVMSSTTVSNSVTDASLVLGIGEYLSSTITPTSNGIALLSTGDDELLASSISSTGVVAGELIFGLIEVMSATNITTSMTIGQIYSGISEIMEGTASVESNTTYGGSCMGRTPMAFRHKCRRSSKGGLFKTT